MARYAANTEVNADRSRQEIERTLKRYGADQFLYGWEKEEAAIRFRAHGYNVTLRLTMPTIADVSATPKGRRRRGEAAQRELEQVRRQRWRALALVVKAKLEAVASGIAMFEDEFLAYTMLPNGQTTGQWFAPQLQAAYQSGKVPKMLIA
jgi:hypothetical protein